MPLVRVRDANLYYETHGSGDPVVLSHGFMDDRSVWAGQLDALVQRHTVVLYDHRGHGKSDKPRGEYSVQTLADDLSGLILALGLGEAALVGHSLGGMTALALALDHPDQVSELVLVCTTARLVPQSPVVGRTMTALSHLVPYRVFARGVMRLEPHQSAQQGRSAGTMRSTMAPRYVAYECGKHLVTDYDLRDRLQDVRARTLIVACEKDMGAPVRMSRFLHRRIKGSVLEVIPGCGHVPMIEKPREFNDILRRFLG